MSHETQSRFADAIERQIDYFRKEFELTYFEAMGVLTFMAHKLSDEVFYPENDEDEDEDKEETYTA